jgi:hypothetical protein
MSSTTFDPPVTERQRALVARLLQQGRVTMQQLLDAEAGRMSRGELAAFIETVIGSQPDLETRQAVEELFGWHSTSATIRRPAA